MALPKGAEITQSRNLFREITALVLLFWAVMLVVALATFHPLDPGFNQSVTPGAPVHNAVGLVGAYMAGLFADFFGLAGYFAPLALMMIGAGCLSSRLAAPWWRWLGLLLLALCLMGGAATAWGREAMALGGLSGGGFFGTLIHDWSMYYLRPLGAGILLGFSLLAGVQLAAGLTWGALFKRLGARMEDRRLKRKERSERRRRAVKAKKDAPAPAKTKAKSKKSEAFKFEEADEAAKAGQALAGEADAAALKASGPPPVDFLSLPNDAEFAVDKAQLEAASHRLTACLEDFGIQGEVQDVTPGPVVTMFEYKPAPGVKISRIANLSDDLALALKATAVRIEAPIPGRDTVGVEIPNTERQTVYLREILDSKEFGKSKSPLSLALGKDIFGRPRVADLARMPHLLVAGATGQGKSVCINSLILSILYKADPDQVKFLLVDPKRIELSVYAKMPHLVHPVVTDMSVAKNALDWAVYEMEQRYEAMARLGVRNIESYNAKLAGPKSNLPEDAAGMEPMPYIVIIIDEMADLMLTARKEVETSIVRLAQLARAAGMHMILATQRPSVDVVTGLIKANFPSRIAFTVTSPQDSRTILDTVGANHLLGKGDMLFKPSGGKPQRLHGALVDEDEIAKVIGYWTSRRPASFDLDFSEWRTDGGDGDGGGTLGDGGEGIPDDPIYPEAVEFVMGQGKASISLIQRRFRIGFNRAARFVEQMERDGIIGPQDGSKPRQVLKSSD